MTESATAAEEALAALEASQRRTSNTRRGKAETAAVNARSAGQTGESSKPFKLKGNTPDPKGTKEASGIGGRVA